MSDAEAETAEVAEAPPVRKPRGRKAKETDEAAEAPPPVRKPRARKAPPSSPPPPPRRRKVRVEIPQPDESPPRCTRAKKDSSPPAPPIDSTLGPEFWGKMLDAHRQQTETSRNEHYASFRIA